jgi:hypothetical protein
MNQVNVRPFIHFGVLLFVFAVLIFRVWDFIVGEGWVGFELFFVVGFFGWNVGFWLWFGVNEIVDGLFYLF